MDPRGCLSIIEELVHAPFKIGRCHLIFNVPSETKISGYTFATNKELIVPLSGSFRILIDNGIEKTLYNLNKPYCGLFISENLWREVLDFSTDAVALVLSSNESDADEYIVNYDDFKKKKKENKTVYDCPIVELPIRKDSSSDLVYNNVNVPFEVKRVFYSYNIPDRESRGAHAHKECHQFLVAVNGSYEVVLDDGTNKRTVLLDQPNLGLHVLPGIWASEQNFSQGAVCLVFASHLYDEKDYVRSYEEFKNNYNNE